MTVLQKSLGDSLAEKAVFLRLDAGTQEAGFLSAFCSLETIPKLIIIKQGLVLEDIDASVSEEDFKKRILSQCTAQPDHPPAITDTATTDISQIIPVPAAVERALGPEDSSAPAPPLSEIQEAAGTTAQPDAPTLQDILAERNNRLEADHQKQRTAEGKAQKEARKAASERQKKMAEKQEAEASSAPHARQDYMTQQRQRQLEARADKERVLKQIQQDKMARQERERQRRLAAQGDINSTTADAPASFAPQRSDNTLAQHSATCSLQIRLFDGTSIRSRFDSSVTLTDAVRAYVDSQSNSDIPYNFREMRTPQPSRTIEISEENQSLQSLGLTPSATLVLVPVKGYTDAYASSGPTGLLSRGIGMGYGLVSGAVGLVSSAVGGVLGYGGDGTREGPYISGVSDETEPSNVEGSRMADAGPSSGIKIRTLADQRKKEDDQQELYNGNQVSRAYGLH